MPKYVYLIRYRDLYIIGLTESLEHAQKVFSPCILEASLETEDANAILKILQRNYSDKRLPQSNYFRLSKAQFNECKQLLKKGNNREDFRPFFNGSKLVITFIIAWFGLTIIIIKFGIQPILDQFN